MILKLTQTTEDNPDRKDTRIKDDVGRSWYLEGITPAEVLEIGSRLKAWEKAAHAITSDDPIGTYACECYAWKVDDAVSQVEDVLGMGDHQIATARGQIEDTGCQEKLTDRDVAIMDIYQRELLAEIAREIDDPWNAANASDFWPRQEYFKIDAPELSDHFPAEEHR